MKRMFGDEEKRWLVVGICLNKVLTPVLRKVIEEEIPQLYDGLIQPPTNIHSQTFASHQECLSPSTLRLNYININNNKTQGSSKHLYDYSVKDDVSLAKLFVKGASFTGFDESLDLSAVLSILCGSPNFVYYGIHLIASDVRAKVRNEWGHCLFTVWTEAYYDECFQLMEDLIKALKLPVLSEAKVLEDLKEWKKRGKIIKLLFKNSTAFHTGRLYHKVQALTFNVTIFERNGTTFICLLLKNNAPLTYLYVLTVSPFMLFSVK